MTVERLIPGIIPVEGSLVWNLKVKKDLIRFKNDNFVGPKWSYDEKMILGDDDGLMRN